MQRFCRYDLRTTDPDAAHAFYSHVLGIDLATTPGLGLWPLHEQARARGAPAHWLGQVGVPDVEEALAKMVARGAERLGPTVQARDGASWAVLRDPFGAVMAVRNRLEDDAPIAWHQLHTRDLEGSWSLYTELFGWTRTKTLDVPDPEGGHRWFAWSNGGPSVGSVANTARWPGVHTQWLHYFPVGDLAAAVAKVVAHGGKVVDTVSLPTGERFAPCDDPQGAAFGLFQRP